VNVHVYIHHCFLASDIAIHEIIMIIINVRIYLLKSKETIQQHLTRSNGTLDEYSSHRCPQRRSNNFIMKLYDDNKLFMTTITVTSMTSSASSATAVNQFILQNDKRLYNV